METHSTVLIGICGAPSVGKTTLAHKLAQRLAAAGAPAHVLPEVARILAQQGVAIDQAMGAADYDAFLAGYRTRDAEARGLAIADRTPVDHYSYLAANANAAPELLARHQAAVLADVRRYRLLLYLPIEFPLRADGFRITDPDYQRRLDEAILALLREVAVPWQKLSGQRAERQRLAEAAVREACPEWFDAMDGG
jgi:nicotinamide riboside kinase